MPYVFTLPDSTSSVNLDPASCTEAIWNLKEVLKNAGWVVKKTFKATGTVLATPNATGNTPDLSVSDLNSTGSWFVIQQPSANADSSVPAAPFNGSRQYLFYRGSNDRAWYIGYSRTGAFANESLVQVAYASDEKAVSGSRSGSNAPSTNYIVNSNIAGGSVLNIGASNTAPFSFYMIGYTAGASKAPTIALLVDAFAAGTFTFDNANPSDSTKSDLDPFVHCCFNTWDSNTTASYVLNNNDFNKRSWFKLNTPSADWKQVSYSVPTNFGVDQINGKVVIGPMVWGDSGNTAGPRGAGATFKNVMSSVSDGALLTVSSAGDRIVFQEITFPWPGENFAPLA